jgi:hypothetical protein
MRLTKTDKEAFVRAVMDDVPKIDYEEMISDRLQAWIIDNICPAEIKAAWKNPEARPLLDFKYTYMPGRFPNLYMVRPSDWGFDEKCPIYDELGALQDKSAEQRLQRNELKERLKALIEGCSTLKVAEARLPEFKEYLPADRDGGKTDNLPAISNVVATLVAAGWPKGATA